MFSLLVEVLQGSYCLLLANILITSKINNKLEEERKREEEKLGCTPIWCTGLPCVISSQMDVKYLLSFKEIDR